MRFARTLTEGDRFRPAHPGQVSFNGRKMDRHQVYRVTKVYPQEPHVVIAVSEKSSTKGIFSLGQTTPVLFPKELDPTIEAIEKFLSPSGRKRVVGYRLLWDGKTDIRSIAYPNAVAMVKLMFSVGKNEYETKELVQLFDDHFRKFATRPIRSTGYRVFAMYRRYLVNAGLIEEILDEVPVTSNIRDANLQGII